MVGLLEVVSRIERRRRRRVWERHVRVAVEGRRCVCKHRRAVVGAMWEGVVRLWVMWEMVRTGQMRHSGIV